MGHLNALLGNDKAFALSLLDFIVWWMFLRRKSYFFTSGSIWVSCISYRNKLSDVAIVMQELNFVRHMLKCDWSWGNINSLCSSRGNHLPGPTCLPTVILTLQVWLLNSTVGSRVILLRNLIKNPRDGTLTSIILLFLASLLDFSVRWRTLTFRVHHHLRRYVLRILMLDSELLEGLLCLLLTNLLLTSQNDLRISGLKLRRLLLLLH